MNNIEILYNTELENKTKAVETVFVQANEKLTTIQTKQEITIKNNPNKSASNNQEQLDE